ncbi:MAG: hypothetical protein WKG01_08595 [Kofleriaceae bacterium]
MVLVLALGCGRDKPKPQANKTPDRAAGSVVLAEQPYFRVEPGPKTPCAPMSPCEARLALSALGDYHVNETYPFKFVADDAPGVEVVGTGTFVRDDAKHGTLTLTFQAARRGLAKIAGTFKLSVCTDDECKIEEPKLAFEIPVD